MFLGLWGRFGDVVVFVFYPAFNCLFGCLIDFITAVVSTLFMSVSYSTWPISVSLRRIYISNDFKFSPQQ